MAQPPTHLDIKSGNIVTMVTSVDNYDITMNGDPANPAGLILDNGGENIINSFSVGMGGASTVLEGVVTVDPGSTMELKHGLTINHGQLYLTAPNAPGSVVLDGRSVVENNGYLDITGAVTLNGSLNVSQQSGVTLNQGATVTGNGTINVNSDGVVAITDLIAGLHANVGDGSLELFSPFNTGTINESANGIVFVANLAAPATSEIFHTASGVADLFSATGAEVASEQFARGERVYAYATDGPGGGSNTGIAALFTPNLNTFQGPHLPVTFTH